MSFVKRGMSQQQLPEGPVPSMWRRHLRVSATRRGVGATVWLCAALGSGSAMAQALPAGRPGVDSLPDSGALQRLQQQQQFLNQMPAAPQAPKPVIHDEQEQNDITGPSSQVHFLLRELTFSPAASHYLSAAQLQAIAHAHVGKQVTYADLMGIVGEINTLYRQDHILTARAVLPPQHVRDGVVRIELVEGKLGQMSVQGNQITHTSWIENWLGMESGQPLDTGALERRIELFNHANSTQLDASLKPGSAFGYTDMLVSASEVPRYQLRTFFDTEGARSVGGNEMGFDGAINGLLGIGDRLGLYYDHMHGADSGVLSYSLPVNHLGGRLGFQYSDLDSRVTSGPYDDYDVKGRSRSGQVQYTQPILHDGAWWLDGAITGGVSRSVNDILGVSLGTDYVRSAGASLTASGLYTRSSFAFTLSNTYNWIGSSLEDTRRADIWNATGTWIQKITDEQYTLVRLGGQETQANLLPSTLALQLGGASTVRGYPLGVIAGDDGYFSNLEWHHSLNAGATGFLFTDFGDVRTQGTPNQFISSAGAGLDVALPHGLTFNVTAAHAFKVVAPEQGQFMVTARVSWQIY